MNVGKRLRELREEKDFSQGEIEKRTGLFRCYISRVENGYTIPSIETLEKFASALELPLYRLMHTGEEPPKPLKLSKGNDDEFGGNGREARYLREIANLLGKMSESNRKLIYQMAMKVARDRK